MWLPWRRRSPHRDRGDRGRHRVADDRARPAQSAFPVPVPTALTAAHRPLAVAHWPVAAAETNAPSAQGTVGLVFADGSEWLLPADDDRGEPLRAMAARLRSVRAVSQ